VSVSTPGIAARTGRYRWKICALLFFAATINYMDRQVLGVLAPELQRSFGWNEAQYGYIVTAFQTAYALAYLFAGRMMDWVGVRLGYGIAIAFWSLASMGHALARSALTFGAARFALGLGEAGNFPAAIKTVAEWFPKKERALATGLFNAGTNVGAVVTPLVVPWIAIHYGWRWAFVLTGMVGFLWLVLWITMYRRPHEHPKLSRGELEYINSDAAEPPVHIHWARLLRHRETWAFALAKFLTDPIWWFFLFWLPKFLYRNYGLSLGQIGLPLVIVYLAADVGSVAGGWLPSFFIGRGWTVNAARKTAMLICALAVAPIVLASGAANLWVGVGLFGLAAGGHQGFSANVYTLVSDMFPRRAVGSVVGIGGTAGAIGGTLMATVAGLTLQYTGSYLPLLLLSGSAYLIAVSIVHGLAPKLAMAQLEPEVNG
jgi:ACS family hexuronate transporter-like MFS transporter